MPVLDLDRFWLFLIVPGRFWLFLIDFDCSWSILIVLDRSRSILIDLDRSWSIKTKTWKYRIDRDRSGSIRIDPEYDVVNVVSSILDLVLKNVLLKSYHLKFRTTLFKLFIQSRFDYCSSVFSSINKDLEAKLNRCF